MLEITARGVACGEWCGTRGRSHKPASPWPEHDRAARLERPPLRAAEHALGESLPHLVDQPVRFESSPRTSTRQQLVEKFKCVALHTEIPTDPTGSPKDLISPRLAGK
jgi:hypothetical protein